MHLRLRQFLLSRPERLEPRDLPSASFQTIPAVPGLDPATQAEVRKVVALGTDNGLRSDAFIKVGDSNTDTDKYLRPVGAVGYNPVLHGLTDPTSIATVNAYHAPATPGGVDSFARNSLADYPGWRVEQCLATVGAELAATHAGVAVIMIGTNDVGIGTPSDVYRAELTELVGKLTAAGVVPILSTLPHNLYSPGFEPRTNEFNQIIADVADGFHVPLMNLSAALDRLPNYGLDALGVHLNVAPGGGGAFGPTDLLYGQNERGLITIQTLAAVRAVAYGQTPGAVAAVSGLTAWSAITPGEPVVAAGPDAGQPPVVTVTDPDTGDIKARFLAFDPSFLGGVRVAVGDLNGDGVADVVAAAGPGGGPVVKAFDGQSGSELFSVYVFEPAFRGGVTVAVGDADGDGRPDLVVGAGPGGGPRVRVFRASDLAVTADFMAFEDSFRGGVSVAVGDFGPGVGAGIAVGPGAGGGGVLKVFDAIGNVTVSRMVYETEYRGGLTVAAGDLDGDGVAELVTGTAADGLRVVVTAADGTVRASFYADGAAAARAGVQVGVVPARKGRPGQLLTGTIDPAGAVGLFDAGGDRVGRVVGSDASVLLAGVFVGGG